MASSGLEVTRIGVKVAGSGEEGTQAGWKVFYFSATENTTSHRNEPQ